MRVKMSIPPAPTASAIGPCPTVIKVVGRPGTGSLPSTIAPPGLLLQILTYTGDINFHTATFLSNKITGMLNIKPCSILERLPLI